MFEGFATAIVVILTWDLFSWGVCRLEGVGLEGVLAEAFCGGGEFVLGRGGIVVFVAWLVRARVRFSDISRRESPFTRSQIIPAPIPIPISIFKQTFHALLSPPSPISATYLPTHLPTRPTHAHPPHLHPPAHVTRMPPSPRIRLPACKKT